MQSMNEVIVYNDCDNQDRKEQYMVCINIIQAKKLIMSKKLSRGTFVKVTINNNTKKTTVLKQEDSPVFDEYFIFNLHSLKSKVINTDIIFSVKQTSHFGSSNLIGKSRINIGNIWKQKGHQLLNKWITLQNDNVVQGYLKISINILVDKTESFDEYSTDTCFDDTFHDVENLKLMLKIYSYTKFPIINEDNHENIHKSKKNNYAIRITCDQHSEYTPIHTNERTFIWNECIFFSNKMNNYEILLELCDTDNKMKTVAVATFALNEFILDYIRKKSNALWFGPNFLNLYEPPKMTVKKNEHFHKDVFYNGSLIFSAALSDSASTLNLMVKEMDVCYENETVALYCCLLNTCVIDENYKNSTFKIMLGTTDEICDSISFSNTGKVCCSMVTGSIINQRKQMCITNLLELSLSKIESSVCNIEKMITKNVNDFRKIIDNIDSIHNQIKDCTETIHSINKPNRVEHISFIINKLHNISEILLSIKNEHDVLNESISEQTNELYLHDYIKRKMSAVSRILRNIKKKIDHNLNIWPDLTLWMTNIKKKAYCKIPLHTVLYDESINKRGIHFNAVQTLFLKPVICSSNCLHILKGCLCVVAKVEAIIWFGPLVSGRNYLPEETNGYLISKKNQTDDSHKNFFLTCPTRMLVQLIVYILRANLSDDENNLSSADPYVIIFFDNLIKISKILENTLFPMWNETLIFLPLNMWITRKRMQESPPLLLLEVRDKKKKMNYDLMGRMAIAPVTKFIDDDSIAELRWINLYKNMSKTGEIFLAAQLTEVNDEQNNILNTNEYVPIPEYYLPITIDYRIDVRLWGLRNLKKNDFLHFYVKKVQISLKIDELEINSEVIKNFNINGNFNHDPICRDFVAPLNENCCPPLLIRLYVSTGLGKLFYYGHHTINNVIRDCKIAKNEEEDCRVWNHFNITIEDKLQNVQLNKVYSDFHIDKNINSKNSWSRLFDAFTRNLKNLKISLNLVSEDQVELLDIREHRFTEHDYNAELKTNSEDWWSRFYSSLDSEYDTDTTSLLKVYNKELEKQKEFSGFKDWCSTYRLYRATKSDNNSYIGDLKALIKAAKMENINTEISALNCWHISNESKRFIVRVYIVRCLNLKPKDLLGSCDPYFKIKLGKEVINENKNYQKKCINPIFGKAYEIQGCFPETCYLKISVWDHDTATKDDLIGSTLIDLEDRFYSKHRASCGMAEIYINGTWRDSKKPSQILRELCTKNYLDEPIFLNDKVIFNGKTFTVTQNGNEETIENICLSILKQWKKIPAIGYELVPEYVETRALYNKKSSYIEQGKIQLWVDIFSSDNWHMKPLVDITPKQPEEFELRLIIWKTEDVILDEYNIFTGTKVSDIYVKCWLADISTAQKTDVHYRSTSGEGIFNWRMIFPFRFSKSERKIIMENRKKILSFVSHEDKFIPKLYLRLMDNDTLSRDDFLGSLVLDLAKCPQGAKSSSECSIKTMHNPCENILKKQWIRGWWPFHVLTLEGEKLSGKADLELQIVSKQFSIANPVGYGRKSPDSLPKPERSKLSSNLLLNPITALKYVVVRRGKKFIISFGFIIMIILFSFVFLYSIPKYVAKKLLQA